MTATILDKPRGWIQDMAYRFLEFSAQVSSSSLSGVELKAPAIVFSPHQDDETLGCGGTIALKRSIGAEVTVVFLTDGRASHSRSAFAGDLSARRRSEALAACAVLGVNSDQIFFLDLPDSRLADDLDSVIAKVESILSSTRAEQIFIPCRLDENKDHVATRSAAVSAMRRVVSTYRRRFDVLEYPVWYWNHWPMTSVKESRRRALPAVWIRTFRCWLARYLVLTTYVKVDEFLGCKEGALAKHETQMHRPVGQFDWPILVDVSGGQWLSCFFNGKEYFHRYSIS